MMSKRKLIFNSGGFTILQVSDAQDLQFVRKAMTGMLEKAYDSVKPDLVVFTGDNILGNHLLDKRFGTGKSVDGFAAEYARMKLALSHILLPLDKRGIPFTAIFGNHDDRNSVTKEEQAEIFRSYSFFTGFENDDSSVRFGSHRLPVFSSDGEKEILSLYMLDSAYYDKIENKCYENVSAETVAWLTQSIQCHSSTAALVFQHIPFPEIEQLIEECNPFATGAVALPDGRYIKLKSDSAKGFLGEFVGHTRENFGEYDALKSFRNVAGIVFGHDHLNNFEGRIDGLRVIQSPGASFRCYGNSQRGVRVFHFNENNPLDFITYTLNYSDLCGSSPIKKLRYVWDADDYEKRKYIFLASAGFSSIALTATIVLKYLLKK